MSYFLPALETAVYLRLTGDTGTGGLCAAVSPLLNPHPAGVSTGIGVYNTIVPPASSGTVFPCAVFMLEAFANQDALRTRCRAVRLTVDVWCDRTPQTLTYNPINRGMAILERLEGDWPAQSAGTPPTYGLDRWQPDLSSSGWACDIFQFENLSTAHTDEQYHWRYELTALVSHTAA